MPFTLFPISSSLALRALRHKGLPSPYRVLGDSPEQCFVMHQQLDRVEAWARAQPGFWWRQDLYGWINWVRDGIYESTRTWREDHRVDEEVARIMRADAGPKGER
jgi:hypothetical protein